MSWWFWCSLIWMVCAFFIILFIAGADDGDD